VSDYFLNEDDAGKVHAEGDHRIHVLKGLRGRLVVDERFQLDFNTAVATGPARPHGCKYGLQSDRRASDRFAGDWRRALAPARSFRLVKLLARGMTAGGYRGFLIPDGRIARLS